MGEERITPDQFSALRRRAEQALGQQPQDLEALPQEEVQHLFHELQVYQIELEMQNEELRRTQRELALARDRYFDLFDLAPVAYLTLSARGLILEANLTAANLLGVERRALLELPFSRFVLPDDQDLYYRLRRRVLDSRSRQTCELRLVSEGGAPFHAHLHWTLAEDLGGTDRCRVTISDISARVRAVEQRHHTLTLLNRISRELTTTLNSEQVVERLLLAVAEHIDTESASLWLWDEHEENGLVCRAIARGKNLSLVNLRLRPDACTVGRVIQTGQSALLPVAQSDPRFVPGFDNETGLQTDSLLAAPLWVRTKVIGALRLANKRSGTFDEEDLSVVETLAASAAIALDNAHLVETLQRYTAELQSRNAELDTFAHTVAHDLQNPLALITGYAEMLRDELAELSDREVRDHADIIKSSAHKMSNVVNELLLLASVRREAIETGPLDMGRILSEALRRVSNMIEQNQARISAPAPEEWVWPVVVGNEVWVEEVWVNYISNAIRYGGRPPCVEVGAQEPQDGMVRFWVRDNGRGLTPEEQGRLFQPFARLDRLRVKGHGLGLSIVRHIVEKLGGEVGVASDGIPGRGCVFSFTLPLAKDENGSADGGAG
jgi:PAS domain S-box-containing protein